MAREILKQFSDAQSDISIRFFVSRSVVDLASGENDVAISPATGCLPDWDSQELFAEQLVPVASAAYPKALGGDLNPARTTPEDHLGMTLLDYRNEHVNSASLSKRLSTHWARGLLVELGPDVLTTGFACYVGLPHAARTDRCPQLLVDHFKSHCN